MAYRLVCAQTFNLKWWSNLPAFRKKPQNFLYLAADCVPPHGLQELLMGGLWLRLRQTVDFGLPLVGLFAEIVLEDVKDQKFVSPLRA